MDKITFTDSYQNRTRKTKRWLGMLAFCVMLFGGQTIFAQDCEISVTISSSTWGDVTTWELLDGNNEAVLSGGPYEDGFSDTQTYTATTPPYTLSITIDDWFWCDNVIDYEVTVGGNIDVSGTVEAVCGDIYTWDFPLETDLTDCIPDCPAPSGLTATDISMTGATLGWTSDGNDFEVEWGVQGFVQGSTDGTIVTGIDTNSYELTVTEGGNYDFYVRQICDDEESTWTSSNFFIPGLGDDCSAPIIVDAIPYTHSDDTANHGNNYDAADRPPLGGEQYIEGTGSEYYLTGNEVVYSFTPTEDGSYNFNTTMPTSDWHALWLFEGCPFTSIVARHTAISGNTRSLPEINLTAGTTYYVIIATWEDSPQTTPYTLTITENSCTNHSATFTTVMSDCDAQEFSIEVNITDMGSAINLEVNDDQGSTTVMATSTGIVTMGPYTFGTPVVITIDNADDGNCSISSDSLTMNACPPANDNCSGAIELTVNSDLSCDVVTSGTTVAATQSMAASPCFGNPDDDVWFSFEATATSHQITISNVVAVEGTSTDMYFQVLSGTCDDFTSLLCSDPNQNTVSGLTVGDTYFVRVYSYYDTSRQTFDICVGTFPPPPANDECSGAEALTVGADFASANIPTSNAGATANSSDPLPTCDEYNFATNGKDIWFTVIVPASGEVTLETRGDGSNSITDTGLQAYSGTCGDLTSLGCNADDGEGNFSKLELVGLTAGETIYVRTWGYNGSFGSLLIAAYGDVDPCDGITTPEIESPQSLDEGQTLADVVVTAGENLTWYTDEGLTETADTSEALTEGEYTFFVTQTVGDCTSEATEVVITVTLSLSEFDTTQLKVYPNPTNSELNISYTDTINQVEVYNLLGQKVITQNFESNNVSLDVSNLSNGSYVLILHANGLKQQVKIVKK